MPTLIPGTDGSDLVAFVVLIAVSAIVIRSCIEILNRPDRSDVRPGDQADPAARERDE